MPMRSSSPNHQSPIANSNEGCLNSSFLEVVGDVGESDTVSRDEGENPVPWRVFRPWAGCPFFFFLWACARGPPCGRGARSEQLSIAGEKKTSTLLVIVACVLARCRLSGHPLPPPPAGYWCWLAAARCPGSETRPTCNWPTGQLVPTS